MRAEIISVGTELLLGHTINTDAAHIARELARLGFDLCHMQVVGDNPDRLEEALRLALKRSDLIITSGGLGPTTDDLTKETVARLLNIPLEENADCLANLKEYFGKRPIGSNQLKQALAPRASIILKNPYGTAAGFVVPVEGGKFICMLPGPPRELVPMLENELSPFLAGFSRKVIKSALLRTFGIGEGAAAEKLADLTKMTNPSVATYAADGEMFVKITVSAENEKSAEAALNPVMELVRHRLGDFIYGRDIECLEQKVVELLRAQGLQLAIAESCTGGLLAKRITDQPGASEIFHLGIISYANEAKERILHVSHETLVKYGAVSPQTAMEMALGVKELANADFGIGITGIAGPDGGTLDKPVGLVYIALAGRETHVVKMAPDGRYLGRSQVRNRAASIALDMLRRQLENLPISNLVNW